MLSSYRYINSILEKYSLLKSFLLLLLLFLGINLIEFVIINYLLQIQLSFEHQNFSFLFFLKAVLLGPLLETFIYQFAIIEISRYFKASNFQSILISGLLFGISHMINSDPMTHSVLGTIAGIFFGYVYIFYKKNPNANAFLMVFLLHSLFNFFVFIINNFEKIVECF